jgi:outer membrane protein
MRASSLRNALLLAALAVAGQAGAVTLAEAWQGVVDHSPEYAAAAARRDAGLASRQAARALWLPTLAGQAGLALRSYQSETTGAQFSAPGFGTSNDVDFRTSVNGGNDHQWSLVAQQPIFDASRVADSQAARARARMAEAQFRQAQQALMLRTAEALAAVVESGARLRAAERQRQSAMRARDSAHARFDSGDLPVTEWREAQAQADALAVAELDAQQANAIANEAFANLTGLAPPALPSNAAASVTGPTGDPGEAPSAPGTLGPVEDWLRRAREQSPLLSLQQEQRAVAEAEVRRWAHADGFQLNLVGQVGYDSLSGSGDYGPAGSNQRVAAVGLQFTVPLFTGGMRSAQRHAADASLRAASADLDATQQQVALQVQSAWIAAGNARARLVAMQRAEASANSRLEATRIGQESGDRTMLDLLGAEGAALQAQAGTVSARCDGLLATLRLAAAAGMLDEPTLRMADTGAFDCTGPMQQ